MSPKKITTADKLEIVDLYRQSGDTTASLAIRYGVSNSTISRILKNSIPGSEYEILIQQKRASKVGGEEEISTKTAAQIFAAPTATSAVAEISDGISKNIAETPDLAIPLSPASTDEDRNAARRLRRRSSAPITVIDDRQVDIDIDLATVTTSEVALVSDDETDLISTNKLVKTPTPSPVARTPVLREIVADSENRYSPPVAPASFTEISIDESEDDDDDLDTEDVNALAAMFGEEIADGDDDDEEDDEEEDTNESPSSYQPLDPSQLLTKDRLHVQITPLSQATLPRTCYIVIDKFAELIVRPLKDFADLGQISDEEVQQRTLPIFDNHRVAKRFSNQRTQRVIKVPDSRVFYKTTQHLKSKGITRLLVDGNIYSLN